MRKLIVNHKRVKRHKVKQQLRVPECCAGARPCAHKCALFQGRVVDWIRPLPPQKSMSSSQELRNITFYGKRDLVDVTKIRILRWAVYSGLSTSALNVSRGSS